MNLASSKNDFSYVFKTDNLFVLQSLLPPEEAHSLRVRTK